MKKYAILTSIALAAATLFIGTSAKAEVVYSNSVNYTFNDFQTGTNLIGDEITLGGTLRNLSYFQFDYYALNVPSDVTTLRLRFYANNVTNSQLFAGPGTLLFDSGTFTVPETNFGGVAFNDFVTGVATPLVGAISNTFTWAVEFSNIGSGNVGLRLYDPPVIGSSFNDYWYYSNNITAWFAKTNIDGSAINFGAYAEAVPEPTVTVLAVLGGLSILWLTLRANDRKRKTC